MQKASKAVLISLLGAAASAGAQMPGAPILQNAWATPGIVVAANYGGSSDGSVFAGAAGWAPGGARFQVSGGVGYQSQTGGSGRTVYGARVAVPFLGGASSTFGLAGFAGIGGGPSKTTSSVMTLPSGIVVAGDSTTFSTEIPVGVAVGWRHAIGGSHGFSLYATPAYVQYAGGSKSSGTFRAAIGGDFGVTSSLGVTAGIDFGSKRPRGFGGPTASQFGAGVSYALGRR